MNKYAVIMAGGAGLRLWPLSREIKPKQFVCVEGDSTMLEQTFDRIQELVPPEHLFVITNSKYSEMTKNVLKDRIPPENIWLEPVRRNTAACIAYAVLRLQRQFEKGSVCFIPADSFVRNKEEYRKTIRLAYEESEKEKGLVIIGVNPTYPATGYGYINIFPEHQHGHDNSCEVLKFIEKPDLVTAKTYLESGRYLWNSGMVAGTVDALAAVIRQHLPGHFTALSSALDDIQSSNFKTRIHQAYSNLPDLSFDNGVLEKCGRLRSIRGMFDWNDIGSLDALADVMDLDPANNAVKSSFHGFDTHDSIIFSTDHTLITTIGISNMIIIKTEDVVLVCPKDRAQEVKAIVQQLKNSNYGEHT